jgi:hypothetical protein
LISALATRYETLASLLDRQLDRIGPINSRLQLSLDVNPECVGCFFVGKCFRCRSPRLSV